MSKESKSGETTGGVNNPNFEIEAEDVVVELQSATLQYKIQTAPNLTQLDILPRTRCESESAYSESSFRYLPSDDEYDIESQSPLPAVIRLNDPNNNNNSSVVQSNGRMPRNFSLPNNLQATRRNTGRVSFATGRRTSNHPNQRQETYANRRMSRMNVRRGSVMTIPEEEDDCPKELILKIRKTLPMKDFREEVRAHRDLEKFLVQPVVLLDCPHTALEMIIESLLDKLQKDLEVDEKITSQASRGFFTFRNSDLDKMASVDQLKETIQGVKYSSEGSVYEESWITALCSLSDIKRSHVGIARLRHPLNFGNKCEEISFVIGIIAPKKEKFTKNAVEIGRTFSSLMSNIRFRHKLMEATTESEFKQVLKDQSTNFTRDVERSLLRDEYATVEDEPDEYHDIPFWHFGRGLVGDVKRRLPFYLSDYTDGIYGKYTIRKVLSTIFFLYFACLLPDIALGKLYEENTKGVIGVSFCVMSQTFGGVMFALFGGQPLIIMLTTAPLALYVKVIFMVSELLAIDFRAMYAMTGLWNSFFLFIMATFNVSNLMKYSTRSTEEIFAFFIALAFGADAIKETISDFTKNYHFGGAAALANATNQTENCVSDYMCYRPENSILFLFLMLGTLWLGFYLIKFETSQFLSATKRELIADYALPISVLIFSFIGSYWFHEVKLTPFNYVSGSIKLERAPLEKLNAGAIFASMGLGLCLSALFFVDDNVCSALVTAPQNKLQKGTSHHWDLFMVGLINAILSIFGLPWVHSALPHSPLHVRALADVEQHVTSFGTVQDEIVRVRETRITGLVSSIMIGLSLLLLPYLQLIPVSVLQGLFLYLALTSFSGNQLYDRLMLVFTEGSSYPPNHYVRKVPQRKLHFFTFCQVIQLAIVCGFGFAPLFYLKMVFPVLILLLLPIRQKVMPKLIEQRYLNVLDCD